MKLIKVVSTWQNSPLCGYSVGVLADFSILQSLVNVFLVVRSDQPPLERVVYNQCPLECMLSDQCSLDRILYYSYPVLCSCTGFLKMKCPAVKFAFFFFYINLILWQLHMCMRYIFDLSNFTLFSPSHPCQFLHLTTNLFPTFLPFDFVCNQLFLKKATYMAPSEPGGLHSGRRQWFPSSGTH